ncbi:hypothetical protein L916_05860 [Phytophthora nicotianae]|uniref:Uncharacterized protein n=1 Tax=Phytophthora nicotianae TaxID=4792 RepID=W2JBE4_PHYNI|nr:hypothetical protein L916_05860 [Phytophthora nicotianae]
MSIGTRGTRVNAKLHSEELKDAYRVWLKDLYDDKPERLLKKLDKKKKRSGGRRARRHQLMQHAQQHTAASALKDVALKEAKLPSLVHTPADKQALQESQNRRHQALVDEANYSAIQYSNQPSWRPGLAFFQQLVRQLLQKTSAESQSGDCSNGVITVELAGFPVLVAPILLRVPIRRQEKALRIRFNELVLDLLQDTSGTWWLLQVKAFTLASTRPASAATTSSLSTKTLPGLSRTQSAPTRFEVGVTPTPKWRKWRCAGRYCACKSSSKTENQQVNGIDGPDDSNEPSGYLTKKMLRSCEFYDDFIQQQDMSLAGGFTEFHSALTFHLQHRLPKRDRSQLYEPQPLCGACVKQYHSLRQQWMETVEAPKTMATHAGLHRKNTQTKDYSEQTLLPPHKLPSLQRTPAALSALNSSYSSPARALSDTSKLTKQEGTTKQSNYLTELAAMEKMLAEHEPPLLMNEKKREAQHAQGQVASVSSSTTNVLSTKSSDHDGIFPTWDGVTRIEEMWQNLTFKPLETQLTEVGAKGVGMKQGYNSIFLQQELAKVVKVSDSTDGDTERANKIHEEVHPSYRNAPTKAVAAYIVQVQHCRRVFEDESYREDLVNNTMSALRSGNSNICLVVTPHSQDPRDKKHVNEAEDELAEMALRSLYIDVKQAIAASSDGLSSDLLLSSWPMRPKVCREISGCITVKLGPA